MFKKLKEDKSGIMDPIPVLILILMVVFVTLVTVDMNKKSILIDEVKGMADVAAAGALAYSVDIGKAYSEDFQLNQSVAKNKFAELFNQSMSIYNGGSMVTGSDIKRVTVRRLRSSYGNNDDRDQYVLEAIVSVTFRRGNLVEQAGQQILRYRDPERGSLITLSEAQNEDNRGKVFVRGSARVILR